MAKKSISKNVKKIVASYIQLLEKDHFPVRQAYVFGSRAKGTQHRWSDIDIAIISSKYVDFDSGVYLLQKAHEVPSRYIIEPHGFNPKDFFGNESILGHEIKTTGIRVK